MFRKGSCFGTLIVCLEVRRLLGWYPVPRTEPTTQGCWVSSLTKVWLVSFSLTEALLPQAFTARAEGYLHLLSYLPVLSQVLCVPTMCRPHSGLRVEGGPPSWKPGLSSYLSNQKGALSLDSLGSAPLPALLSLRLSSSHSSDVYAVTYQSRGFQEP